MKRVMALGLLSLAVALMFSGNVQAGVGNACFSRIDPGQFLSSKQFLLWNVDPLKGQPFEFVYGLVGSDSAGQPLFVGVHCDKIPRPSQGNPHFVPVADVTGTDFSATGFSGTWTPVGEGSSLNFVAAVTGIGLNGYPTWTADRPELLGGSGKSFWW